MDKKQSWWQIFFKAAVVGGTMTVPGASGGTMAMILGIYEDLIQAVGGILRHLQKSLCFLALFCVGALAGMAALARGVLALLERYPVVTSYFFLGAVAGGIPLICRRTQIKKMTWQALVWPLTGLFIVYVLASLPKDLFTAGLSGNAPTLDMPSLSHFLWQFLGGCILAVALILPGISVSQMLLMLGLYEPVMEAVSKFRFASLIPMGLGAVLCTLLFTRLLGNALDRRPQPTYLLILGFVLGSLGQLYPGQNRSGLLAWLLSGLPAGWELLFAPLAAIAGYQLLARISRRAE